MRTRKKKWAPAELENNPRILRDLELYKGRSAAEYFTNGNPIHLEIGCGKGRFITEMSLRCPGINFIAIEREPTILAAAARLAREVNAGSLVFVMADVNDILDYFKPGDISRLYINFCDPWPGKKKRAKRRLTHDNYLAKYEELQISEIFFKTDNQILFEASLESFSRMKWTLRNVSLNLHESDMKDNIMTEYEEKFSPHGPIYRLEALRPNL
jgi:tRNA (guanine-N7-)-methyltransferase